VINAQETARTLVAMNESLNSSDLQLSSAQENLDSLMKLQSTLSHQSKEIASAIQNLEIMDDFRVEVASHVKSLDTLRRTLMDIAMMESTMGRVANVVEPLTQIGNLRRLNDDEVREAARVILDRRMTRFSQNESKNETVATEASQSDVPMPVEPAASQEELVPLPPEARE
jgi:hypothetical protein